MQHPRPHTDSSLRPSSYAPAQFDNAKSLTSSMMDSQGRLFTRPSEPGRSSFPTAGNREPLLGHPSTRESRGGPGRGHATEPSRVSFSTAGDREPLLGRSSTRGHHGSSERGLATAPRRRNTGRFGLPVIVLCRLFNTIFAICTVDKANRDAVEPWNLRINRLVFDFCWVILVWNIFALAASIVSCVFFPPPPPRRIAGGEEARRRGFRDKLHAQFAINDAVLALITLVLLMIACYIKKDLWQARLLPSVVAMVSTLV